ncbi:T9SS type A sorting domain-containing protein [Mucilaginibacter angelicae]|uniref:T9SS type A sorting domain-containing protein n=1 Tax=Mucilaginibacter angelicae TaxID=869718 RepID=A0ABV6LBE7_9SPHI
MKKLLLQTLSLFIVPALMSQANAQAPVKAILSGGTCTSSTLTGTLSSGFIDELKWYRDSALIEVRSRYDANATIVVGGNGTGTSLNNLYGPTGIYIYHGDLYIADLQRVTKWAPGATAGILVAGGNGKGRELNQLASPGDITVDKNGDLYISDYLTNSVRKWKPGANSGTIVAGGNGYGSAANQIAGPQSICIDRFGNLYVSDRWNNRVQKWTPGATTGITVAGGNGRGPAANQLYEPSGIAVDYAGNVYVADGYNYRVQKWAPGATTGVTVAGGNGQGIDANQLTGPGELSVDSAGAVYVVDGGIRIQKWAPGASYGITVAGSRGYPTDPNQADKISSGSSLFVDPDGQIYISEMLDNRVKKFKPTQFNNAQLFNTVPGTYTVAITSDSGKTYTSQALKVIAPPAYPAEVEGPDEASRLAIVQYEVKAPSPDAAYTWTIPADATILSGQGTYLLTVKWGYNGGEISVTASNACDTTETNVKYISVSCTSADAPPYPALIGGPTTVNRQDTVSFNVQGSTPGTGYTWNVPPDVSIISGQGTDKLTVTWGNNSGDITVTAYNSCAISNPGTKSVTVPPIPQSDDNLTAVAVYPNPTTNTTSVAFTTEKTATYELTVINMAGKTLLRQKGRALFGSNKANLDLSGFSKGIYLLNIKYNNNITNVLKLSKQ